MSSFFPGLRRAVPRLSRDFFICHQCRKQSLPLSRLKLPVKANLTRTIRFNSSAAAFPEANTIKNSPLGSLSKSISNAEREKVKKVIPKKGFFPKTTSNGVAYWLLGSAVSVFGIVVFGGLTRLTESGYVESLLPRYCSDFLQTQYNGMATSNWLPPSTVRGRLGL